MSRTATTCQRCEAVSAYLRDALELVASAIDVETTAYHGPKPNGVLLDDILVALGRPIREGARL